MSIEHPPEPSIGIQSTLRRYRPPKDEIAKYHVVAPGRRETLETVARANGIGVKELLAFNFPGTVVRDRIVPAVVNWYLRHHSEFKCPATNDWKNDLVKGRDVAG